MIHCSCLFYFDVISGLIPKRVLENYHCRCGEIPSLRALNLSLENTVIQERQLRETIEAADNLKSIALERALKKLSDLENKLKNLRTSFQFLKAGISGFSNNFNGVIESLENNFD